MKVFNNTAQIILCSVCTLLFLAAALMINTFYTVPMIICIIATVFFVVTHNTHKIPLGK